MFGRLDEDPDISREYMIVSNYIDEDPLVFNVQATPEEAKEYIRGEIETYKNVGFAIYELVEFAEVLPDREVEFTEDWATGEVIEDEQEDQ
jgi:hypothetical protein